MYASGLGACACIKAPCDCTDPIDFGLGDEWNPAPVTTGDFSRLDRGQVTTTSAPPLVLDRSATLGDLATLGGLLSMVMLLTKAR